MLKFRRAGVPVAMGLSLIGALCLSVLAMQAQAQSAADGQAAFVRGDYTQAERIWRPMAERGIAAAQIGMGNLYATGRGVAQDFSAAAAWFTKAAEQGDALAQSNLASLYMRGNGVAQDDAAAVMWYRRAAEQGSAAAQSSLGFLLEYGRGGPKDETQAAQWYRKAAVQGNAVALTNLASMADEGRGVMQDKVLAAALFARAVAAAPTRQDIASQAQAAQERLQPTQRQEADALRVSMEAQTGLIAALGRLDQVGRPAPATVATNSGNPGNSVAGNAGGGTRRAAAAPVIEETVVVPRIDAANAVLSPRGGHVAAVISRGSRAAVLIDGVEGPRYDQVLQVNGETNLNMLQLQFTGFGRVRVPQVIFSADGRHHAFAAKNGNELVVVLDGKEIARTTFHSTVLKFFPLTFEPSGVRLRFALHDAATNALTHYVDGQALPPTRQQLTVDFSPDGSRYTAWGFAPNGARWSVFDGKLDVADSASARFLSDNRLLVAEFNKGRPPRLLVDGKVLKEGPVVMRAESPARSSRWVLWLQQSPSTRVVEVDGKVLPDTEGVDLKEIHFSPDGKRYALVCARSDHTGTQTFVIVDGKKDANAYQMIGPIRQPFFSADSKHYFYVGIKNNWRFPVVDGKEFEEVPMYGTLFYMHQAGPHFAWAVLPQAGQALAPALVVDGIPVAIKQPVTGFKFSPDGSRRAWLEGNPLNMNGSQGNIVVDGAIVKDAIPAWAAQDIWNSSAPTFTFSPDSRHLAYMATGPAASNGFGLMVDGKLVHKTPDRYLHQINFTADSKHLAWTGGERRPDGSMSYPVYVDGVVTVTSDESPLSALEGSWTMLEDGSFIVVGKSGAAIKRWHITPSTDTSVASLLAAGVK
jgi:hypothetical protein